MLSSAVAVPIFGIGIAGAAFAANDPYERPPDGMAISPGGVDMRSGRYVIDQVDLEIAPDSIGGIVFKRTTPPPHSTLGLPRNNNWEIILTETKDCSNCTTVQVAIDIEGLSYNFNGDPQSGVFGLISNNGFGKLTRTLVSGGNMFYTLTTVSGLRVDFQTIAASLGSNLKRTTYPSVMTSPNGVVFTYGLTNDLVTSVTSNAGYTLILERGSSGITRSCVVNMAVASMTTTCPTAASQASYTYSNFCIEQRHRSDGGGLEYRHHHDRQ